MFVVGCATAPTIDSSSGSDDGMTSSTAPDGGVLFCKQTIDCESVFPKDSVCGIFSCNKNHCDYDAQVCIDDIKCGNQDCVNDSDCWKNDPITGLAVHCDSGSCLVNSADGGCK